MNFEVSFDVNSIYHAHHKVKYRGITTRKCPFDYVLLQMLINEIKPDLVIEIGTNEGGSSLYIADLMDNIKNGVVHTIDIVSYVKNESVINHPRINFFLGGYKSYDVNQIKNYNKVIVIDDGSHMYDEVKEALNLFKNHVSNGSYYIVEDGIIDKLGLSQEYDGGPNRAIKEFLEENHNYMVDYGFCDFFGKNATFNTFGYLKKYY